MVFEYQFAPTILQKVRGGCRLPWATTRAAVHCKMRSINNPVVAIIIYLTRISEWFRFSYCFPFREPDMHCLPRLPVFPRIETGISENWNFRVIYYEEINAILVLTKYNIYIIHATPWKCCLPHQCVFEATGIDTIFISNVFLSMIVPRNSAV